MQRHAVGLRAEVRCGRGPGVLQIERQEAHEARRSEDHGQAGGQGIPMSALSEWVLAPVKTLSS